MSSPVSAPLSSEIVTHRPPTWVTVWGVLGVMALLSSGVWRVFPHALEPLQTPGSMTWFQAVLYGGCILFNAWTEGYKAFQKMIAPRVIARAQWMTDHPNVIHPLVAPIFVGGFFAMERRAIIVRYTFLIVIIGVIVGMKFVPQPWRGIIDAGVVVGLGWGVFAIGFGLIQLFRGVVPDADPQLPTHWLEKHGDSTSAHSRP